MKTGFTIVRGPSLHWSQLMHESYLYPPFLMPLRKNGLYGPWDYYKIAHITVTIDIDTQIQTITAPIWLNPCTSLMRVQIMTEQFTVNAHAKDMNDLVLRMHRAFKVIYKKRRHSI